jgi:hypothetical protein
VEKNLLRKVEKNPLKRVEKNLLRKVEKNPLKRVEKNPLKRVEKNPLRKVEKNLLRKVEKNLLRKAEKSPLRKAENHPLQMREFASNSPGTPRVTQTRRTRDQRPGQIWTFTWHTPTPQMRISMGMERPTNGSTSLMIASGLTLCRTGVLWVLKEIQT